MSIDPTTTDPSALSAYDRAAAAGADPRCIPVRLDAPPPRGRQISHPTYGMEEHRTWEKLFRRQRELLPGRACDEYLEGLELMRFPQRRIPALRDVGEVLRERTGWQVARVPGLLHECDFFEQLAQRVFPSTDYIRPPHELDYTPAPDLFHDVFGHTPLIANREFADFYQRMGQAALRAQGADRRRLERFYWFTVEFGLIRAEEGVRIYGNGILSSRAETLHSLSDAVHKVPFDPARIVEQEYDVWHLQPLLFVVDSFSQLAEGFDSWARRRGLG